MIHHVFGNGESRKDLDISKLEGTKYGCNAIYRDWYTDYLFNKDKPIQHEILDSYCWQDRKVIEFVSINSNSSVLYIPR